MLLKIVAEEFLSTVIKKFNAEMNYEENKLNIKMITEDWVKTDVVFYVSFLWPWAIVYKIHVVWVLIFWMCTVYVNVLVFF